MNTYVSPKYHPDLVETAYVRYVDLSFHFIEVNKERYDIRQGSIEAEAIPLEIQIKAIERSGKAYSYVEVDKALTLAIR